MNLCLVTREYPPNPLGGIGTYVVNLCRLLARAGHEVTVLTQASPHASEAGLDQPVFNEDRVRVYYLPFVDPRWELLPAAASPEARALSRLDIAAAFAQVAADALEVIVPRHRIELVEGSEYEAPLALHLGRRHLLPHGHPARSVPCVVHLHSPSHLIFEHNDEDLSLPWIGQRSRLELASIRAADALLTPSAYLGEQVRRECGLPENRIRVLPYPMGDPLPPGTEVAFPESGDFQCLHVGRVEPRKGVFEWVEAAVRLLDEGEDLQLHFVGGSHQRATTPEENSFTTELLCERIPEVHRDRFHFHEEVPRDKLGGFYRQADLCVVPSRWDNFPNTCLEAMFCGKPVLASAEGGMAEMIEDGISGFLAQASYGDRGGLADALAHRLREILQTSPAERDRIGEAARARIHKLCDNESVLDEHLRWYREVIAVAATQTATLSSSPAPPRPVLFLLVPDWCDPDCLLPVRSAIAGLQPGPPRVEEILLAPGSTRTEIPFSSLADRVAALPESTWVVLLGPGLLPTPEYGRALEALHEERAIAFAAPWLSHSGQADPEVFSATDPANLLQHTQGAGLAAAFRAGPLAPLLREFVPASYLRDVSQHLLIRLQETGHTGVVVPAPLAEVQAPGGPLWRHGYGFAAERDSRLALLRAHAAHLEFPFHGETLPALLCATPSNGRAGQSSSTSPWRARFWQKLLGSLRR